MKISIFQKAKNWITRNNRPSPGDDFWYTYPGQSTDAGVKVSEKTALTYLTVFACVSLIAGDLARLPLILYKRRADSGKDRASDHPLYDILHNVANNETTSFNWREVGQGQCLLWGNHFSFIERDTLGKIKGLWQLLDPDSVEMQRVGNQIIYKYKNGNGQEVIRTKDQIFHVAGFGHNGLFGKSMITLAREAIGLGLATEKFGAKYFGEGTHPAGALEMDGYLGDKRDSYVKAFKKGYSGLGRSHAVMLLEGGAKYKPMTIPLEDAQFLQTRDHQKIEICGMYHVPPHKIAIHGQNSNYNNLEQENASYVDSCLMHWLVRWESAISHQLLTPAERKSGLFAEFLVDGLLRGDSSARADYYSKMVANGAMSPNDIRIKENQNPIEGGDQYFVPLNYMTLKQAGEMGNDLTKKDNPEPDIKSLRSFFSDNIDSRSITVRDRIAKRYYPLFKNALQAIVNKETKAIKKQIAKRNKRENTQNFKEWLDEFYRTFDEYIKKQASPVFRSFMESIRDETINEINVKIDESEIDNFINDYIDTYAIRHIASSTGQLTALDRDETDEEINQRVDEWYEKRAEKGANNETVRASNAVFQAVVFAAGMTTVWRIRGAKTCLYCKSLNGKRVSKGQSYVKDGESIQPEGSEKMKIRGTKAHPPLHAKCLPGDTNITAIGITASSEDWFDGNLFIVYTASGNKVSCTPNHPILTSHGWIAADKIKIGDQVRKAVFPNRDASIIGNDKDVKALIKDISKSFINPGKMIAIPVPATPENFQGDLVNSKITIIRADGSLLLESDPRLFHEFREFNLKLRDSDLINFTTDSAFAAFVKSRLPSDRSLVSCQNLLRTLGSGHFFPVEFPSSTLSPELDAMHSKVFINNGSGNIETIGDRVDGFSGKILRDKVVRIESNVFHGLVYNLRTKNNLFCAENIIVHNCDCYLSIR